MESLAGRIILIVGADSDVGIVTAKTLARYSASLALCGTNTESLNQLAGECRRIGLAQNRVLTLVKTDLYDENQINEVVNATVKTFGSLYSLVYLCDEQCARTFEESTVDDLNRMHVCHVESPLLWTQRSIPHLKLTKGNISILSSGYSRLSVVGMFPYALVKAAEDQLVRVMALDLAGYGIRVNAVCPLYESEKSKTSTAGPINTAAATSSTYSSSREAVISSMSEYISYLSSDPAAFITGQCVTIGDAFKVDAVLTIT